MLDERAVGWVSATGMWASMVAADKYHIAFVLLAAAFGVSYMFWPKSRALEQKYHE